jgi:hypothetical protein
MHEFWPKVSGIFLHLYYRIWDKIESKNCSKISSYKFATQFLYLVAVKTMYENIF